VGSGASSGATFEVLLDRLVVLAALPPGLPGPRLEDLVGCGCHDLARGLAGVAPLFLMCDPGDLGVVAEMASRVIVMYAFLVKTSMSLNPPVSAFDAAS
jgi:hypothetical protein